MVRQMIRFPAVPHTTNIGLKYAKVCTVGTKRKYSLASKSSTQKSRELEESRGYATSTIEEGSTTPTFIWPSSVLSTLINESVYFLLILTVSLTWVHENYTRALSMHNL